MTQRRTRRNHTNDGVRASPKAAYQIEGHTLTLLRSFGTAAWIKNLAKYLKTRQTMTTRYAKEREMKKLPVKLATGETIRLSPGAHNELLKSIIEGFAPRFVPGGVFIYAGDTGDKWGYFDAFGQTADRQSIC